MSYTDSESIGLADFIQQVRNEIMQSVEGSGNDTPILAVDEVELTIGITVAKRAEGGLTFYVVQVGAGVERSDVHSVRVKLLPLLTFEERRLELQKDTRWHEVVQTAIKATLKGISSESPRDLA